MSSKGYAPRPAAKRRANFSNVRSGSNSTAPSPHPDELAFQEYERELDRTGKDVDPTVFRGYKPTSPADSARVAKFNKRILQRRRDAI